MVQPGFFALHPAVLPPLPAGHYTLHGEIEDMPHGPTAPIDARLTVSSPRFTMPPDQILSTFPPANREGAFQATLPQIVLKRRTLPWERKVDPADEHVPWLALVVIAEGEGSLSAESPVEQCITSGVALPDPTDRDVATSVYLSVTQTVVNGVFPTKDDLELLAHVREVDLNDSELMSGDDDGFLAVVIANRLPQPGFDDGGNPIPKKYLACLINVEGQTNVLPPPVPDNSIFEFAFDAVSVVQDLRPEVQQAIGNPDKLVMGGAIASRQFAGGFAAPRRAGFVAHEIAEPADTTSTAFHAGAAWAQGPAAIDEAAVSVASTDASKFVRDAMAGGWQLPIEIIALEPTYRFPVLAHWSFTVTRRRHVRTTHAAHRRRSARHVGRRQAAAHPGRDRGRGEEGGPAAERAARARARRDRARRPRSPDRAAAIACARGTAAPVLRTRPRAMNP